jgi:hypothetical protein
MINESENHAEVNINMPDVSIVIPEMPSVRKNSNTWTLSGHVVKTDDSPEDIQTPKINSLQLPFPDTLNIERRISFTVRSPRPGSEPVVPKSFKQTTQMDSIKEQPEPDDELIEKTGDALEIYPPNDSTQQAFGALGASFQMRRRTSELKTRNLTVKGKPLTEINVEYVLPTTSVQADAKLPKTLLPYGVITQFTVPVSDYVAPTISRQQRRSFSYRNSVTSSGEFVSIDKWTNMIHAPLTIEDQTDGDNVDIGPTEQTACPDFIPIKDGIKGESSLNSLSGLNSGSLKCEPKRVTISSPTPPQAPNVIVYKAILIGSDTDFLQHRKMREMFRNNASCSEEYNLFSLATFKGAGIPEIFIIDQPKDCCGNPTYRVNTFCGRNRYFLFLGSACFLLMTFTISLLIVSVV